MNKISEWYKNYVIFIGVFTLLAMGILFINLLGWFKGTAITLGFSSVIGGLVWYSLVKIKPVQITTREANPREDYRLILSDSLSRLEAPWKKIIVLHSMIVLFLNVNFFWIAPELFSKIFYLLLSFIFFWRS